MLKIYKASAGAGKTFALTVEYFKILFSNPSEYKNILAVTFTNKATEEMKGRILNELHILAENQKSAYKEILMNDLCLSEAALHERARLLRTLLLHDYSSVAVTTIDRFFQRIVKGFTKELGIFQGYNIELDGEKVLHNSIDKMLQKVKSDPLLRGWIDELISSNMEEGKSWSIQGKIANLGEELFKESYRLLDEETLENYRNKELIRSYRLFVEEICKNYEAQLSEIGNRATTLISERGLVLSDFTYGVSGPAAFFFKLKQGIFEPPKARALEASENEKKWCTQKSAKKADIMEIVPLLQQGIKDALIIINENRCQYIAASEIKRHIYLLGILNDLYSEVRSYCSENGLMLLSDTTHMLNKLLRDNAASFVYEKCGNHFKHIMIDEFQDTSTMQWNNFKPLLENSIAQDATTLLVGDVKQSIYRWRNSDWQLLATGVADEFGQENLNEIILENNWRSAQEVVNFNNHFFKIANVALYQQFIEDDQELNDLGETIVKAYKDVEQNPKKNDSGYVEVKFFTEESECFDEIMGQTIAQIEELRGRGISYRDIAILVRTGREGAFIANGLIQYNRSKEHESIPFISNDSLYVWNSIAIKLIVSVLALLNNSMDIVAFASVKYFYYRYFKPGADLNNIFDREDGCNHEVEQKVKACRERVSSRSLYEQVEHIVQVFGLHSFQIEQPYIIAFLDVIYKYEDTNPNNMSQFLEWWDNEKKRSVLTTSEDSNAVKILTIHKSKGLEYDYVFIPFCNWKLDSVMPLRRIWCTNREPRFDVLSRLPLTYSKKLCESSYREDFYEEHLKAFVDNLNLLYVAFTRAKYELYIYPILKEGRKTLDSISDLIAMTIGYIDQHPFDEIEIDEELNLCYGSKRRIDSLATSSNEKTLPFKAKTEIGRSISIKLRYKDFDSVEDDLYKALDEGKILHRIFQSIINIEDIAKAVNQAVIEGLIEMAEKEYYIERIENYFDIDQVKEWFSNNLRVISERDILIDKQQSVRPDRVVIFPDGQVYIIDYKFGKRKSKKYNSQVKSYCNILNQMGYKHVQGKIWYVEQHEIESI